MTPPALGVYLPASPLSSGKKSLLLTTLFTMSTPSKPDTVEQVVSEYSDPEITKDKSTVRFEEKAVDTEIVVELQDGTKRNRPLEYVRSFRDAFTVQNAREAAAVMVKFGKFVGPGTIITVAYIDPDNFQTAVSSGAQFKYKLLFMVLISNLIAIYLQVSKPQAVSVREVSNYAGFGCQTRISHRTGSGTDEPGPFTTVAQLWTLVHGRGCHRVYRHWPSMFCDGRAHEFLTHLHIGHWDCHRDKYSYSQDTIDCRLCFGYCRHSFHTSLLSSRWVTEGSTSIRALHLGICTGRLHLLLYRAFPRHWHNSSSCHGWLPPIKRNLCIRWVGLYLNIHSSANAKNQGSTNPVPSWEVPSCRTLSISGLDLCKHVSATSTSKIHPTTKQ